MENLSTTPIASGILKHFKKLIITPLLLSAPMIAGIDVDGRSLSLKTEYEYPEKTISDSELQKELESVTLQISEILIPQVDFALSMLDTIINSAFYVSSFISDEELNEFGKDVVALKHICHYLVQYAPKYRGKQNLVNAIEKFSEKVEELYIALYADKYKKMADHVVVVRSYQGKESVGYTFDPKHSFDDFKKAVLG